MKLRSIIQAAQKGDLKGCQNYEVYVDGKPIRFFRPESSKNIIELTTEEPAKQETPKYTGPVVDADDTGWEAPVNGKGQFELW